MWLGGLGARGGWEALACLRHAPLMKGVDLDTRGLRPLAHCWDASGIRERMWLGEEGTGSVLWDLGMVGLTDRSVFL